MYSEQMTQGLAIPAKIDPQTINGASVNTGAGIDMSLYERALFILNIGANAGSVTAKLQGATASGGSFGDIAGATVTAITSASKIATIEIRGEQCLDTYRYVKMVVTEGNSANAIVSATVLGGEAAHKPANANNLAAVTQQTITA